MKSHLLLTTFLFAILLSGCSGEKKAAELLETAHFEEKQNNREHAIRLYEIIVKKYPDTAAANGAGRRLDELKK